MLFPEAMLPSTAIIKGREVVEVVDKMVEFFDIEMLEMLPRLRVDRCALAGRARLHVCTRGNSRVTLGIERKDVHAA